MGASLPGLGLAPAARSPQSLQGASGARERLGRQLWREPRSGSTWVGPLSRILFLLPHPRMVSWKRARRGRLGAVWGALPPDRIGPAHPHLCVRTSSFQTDFEFGLRPPRPPRPWEASGGAALVSQKTAPAGCPHGGGGVCLFHFKELSPLTGLHRHLGISLRP